MKKIFLLFLALFIIIGVGCSDDNKEDYSWIHDDWVRDNPITAYTHIYEYSSNGIFSIYSTYDKSVLGMRTNYTISSSGISYMEDGKMLPPFPVTKVNNNHFYYTVTLSDNSTTNHHFYRKSSVPNNP